MWRDMVHGLQFYFDLMLNDCDYFDVFCGWVQIKVCGNASEIGSR